MKEYKCLYTAALESEVDGSAHFSHWADLDDVSWMNGGTPLVAEDAVLGKWLYDALQVGMENMEKGLGTDAGAGERDTSEAYGHE